MISVRVFESGSGKAPLGRLGHSAWHNLYTKVGKPYEVALDQWLGWPTQGVLRSTNRVLPECQYTHVLVNLNLLQMPATNFTTYPSKVPEAFMSKATVCSVKTTIVH